MTPEGGANGMGVIFALNKSGAYFAFYHFGTTPNDGDEPSGGLISDGSRLYGVTEFGGMHGAPSGYGTIFRIDNDGSNYWIIHDFDDVTNDGRRPQGPLLLRSGRLYGVTRGGGTWSGGTIFSVSTDGLDYQILHHFTGGPDEGSEPAGGLFRDGNTLYGTTRGGGAYVFGFGTVYSINTDGSGYRLLHSFSGGDGALPTGPLVSDGSALYGMCSFGGTSVGSLYYGGTAFSMNPDGSGFQVLHEFQGEENDGYAPLGALTLDGDTLYGSTFFGGAAPLGAGVIFSMSTGGSNFDVLYTCDGLIEGDGSGPAGSMVLDGDTLYGMMSVGGSSGEGVAFSLVPPSPTPTPSTNYVDLTAAPGNVSGGARITLSWQCDFSRWNYQGVPVNIYLAAIRNPNVIDGPSSVSAALSGGAVYMFGPGMGSVYQYSGSLQAPTFSNTAFPPAPTSGSIGVDTPSSSAFAGNYVFGTAFIRGDTGQFVRTDGLPVENSNAFSIQ